MKRNGTLTAHSREWPLYERYEVVEGRTVTILSLSDKDRAEKESLDRIAIQRAFDTPDV
jgi:hypothetical protein